MEITYIVSSEWDVIRVISMFTCMRDHTILTTKQSFWLFIRTQNFSLMIPWLLSKLESIIIKAPKNYKKEITSSS